MVIRINEFRAKADKAEALKAFLTGIIPMMLEIEGCQSSQLLESHHDSLRFVVLETWDSIQAHKASVAAIPPDAFAEVTPLLDGMPKGEYFKN